jgi:hypothetical protein
MTALFKVCAVLDRSNTRIAGSNPSQGMTYVCRCGYCDGPISYLRRPKNRLCNSLKEIEIFTFLTETGDVRLRSKKF